MAPPIQIPDEVREWLRRIFASCNAHASEKITKMPNIHEQALDMAFIESLQGAGSPRTFQSGWTVSLATHFLGGGRHFSEWPGIPPKWEIADIGFLVLYRQGSILVRSKVALLQSKRLYPVEQALDEDSPLDYLAGFSRLYESDDEWGAVTTSRVFTLNEESRYRALIVEDGQYGRIRQYEEQHRIPVYYLLYNPCWLPHSVTIPTYEDIEINGGCDVGCRIVPASDLRVALSGQQTGSSPRYRDLASDLSGHFSLPESKAGWRLENFVADLLIECEVGYIAASRGDAGLNYVFNRRSGPIAAAIAVTIDAP